MLRRRDTAWLAHVPAGIAGIDDSRTRLFSVEVSLQARDRDSPGSSNMDCRTEPARATQTVESVGVQSDAPGRFRDRDEIGSSPLISDVFEHCQ